MVDRVTPSKSEVMSLGHSESIGADCIMLSEETALSENGTVIIDCLDDFFSSEITAEFGERTKRPKKDATVTVWDPIADISNAKFLIMSKSGYALNKFFSVRPNENLYLITNNNRFIKLVQLYRNYIHVYKKEDLEKSSKADIIWDTVKSNKLAILPTQIT